MELKNPVTQPEKSGRMNQIEDRISRLEDKVDGPNEIRQEYKTLKNVGKEQRRSMNVVTHKPKEGNNVFL